MSFENNPIINAFGSVEMFRQRYAQLTNNLNQNGMTPEAYVQQLLNSGRMTQEQFMQLSNIANQILGKQH